MKNRKKPEFNQPSVLIILGECHWTASLSQSIFKIIFEFAM